jgi:tRNA A-37 threonylcarbamoyl transferase component Bud32
MSTALTLDAFQTARDAFAVDGDEMRTHKGRSVVAVEIDGRRHYLKRFWFTPSQVFKRYVARGFHEMRMIDWLNGNGFAGPKIVRRGHTGRHPFVTRVYFLMEEVPDEVPLETAWRKSAGDEDGLLADLASFSARLHDAGFVHTDFSGRHILVGREAERRTFRLIDVERAAVGRIDLRRSAADLATLATSVIDEELRRRIETDFLDSYIAKRSTLNGRLGTGDFRSLVERAEPAGSFDW